MNTTLPNRNILLAGTALSRPLKPLMWVSANHLGRNHSVTPPVYLWTHNFTEDRKALSHKDSQTVTASPKRTTREHGRSKVCWVAEETRDDPNSEGQRRQKKVSSGKERTRRAKKNHDREEARTDLISEHETEGETKREVLVSVNRNSPDPDRARQPDMHHAKHHINEKIDANDLRRLEAPHRSLPVKQYSLHLPSGSAQLLNPNFPPEKSSPAVRRSLSTKIALSRPFIIDENLGDQEYGEWVSHKLRVELGCMASEKPNLRYIKSNEDGNTGRTALELDELPPAISKSKNANCWNVELHQSTPPAPTSKYPSSPKVLKSKKKVAFEPAFHHHGGSVFSDVNFDDLSLRPRITTVSESIYPFPPPNYIFAAPPLVPHVPTTDTLVIGTGMSLSAAKMEKYVRQLKKTEYEMKRRTAASQKYSTPKHGRSDPGNHFAAVPIHDAIADTDPSFENDNELDREPDVTTYGSGSRKLGGSATQKDKSLPRSSASLKRSAKASSEKELRKKIVIPGSSASRPHSSPSTSKSSRRPRSSSSSKSRKKERRPSVPIFPTEIVISEEERLAKTMIIQRWTRMCLARRKYRRILQAVPIIQDFWRKHTSYMPAEFY